MMMMIYPPKEVDIFKVILKEVISYVLTNFLIAS